MSWGIPLTCVNGACTNPWTCGIGQRCIMEIMDTASQPDPTTAETEISDRPSEIRKEAVNDFEEINRIMNRRPK